MVGQCTVCYGGVRTFAYILPVGQCTPNKNVTYISRHGAKRFNGVYLRNWIDNLF